MQLEEGERFAGAAVRGAWLRGERMRLSGGQDQLDGSGSEDQNEGLWEPHPT